MSELLGLAIIGWIGFKVVPFVMGIVGSAIKSLLTLFVMGFICYAMLLSMLGS